MERSLTEVGGKSTSRLTAAFPRRQGRTSEDRRRSPKTQDPCGGRQTCHCSRPPIELTERSHAQFRKKDSKTSPVAKTALFHHSSKPDQTRRPTSRLGNPEGMGALRERGQQSESTPRRGPWVRRLAHLLARAERKGAHAIEKLGQPLQSLTRFLWRIEALRQTGTNDRLRVVFDLEAPTPFWRSPFAADRFSPNGRGIKREEQCHWILHGFSW